MANNKSSDSGSDRVSNSYSVLRVPCPVPYTTHSWTRPLHVASSSQRKSRHVDSFGYFNGICARKILSVSFQEAAEHKMQSKVRQSSPTAIIFDLLLLLADQDIVPPPSFPHPTTTLVYPTICAYILSIFYVPQCWLRFYGHSAEKETCQSRRRYNTRK